MSRYLLLYTFHRTIKHLSSVDAFQKMNPNVMIVPVFGVAQTLSVPLPKLPKRYQESFDWTSCKSRNLFKITETLNTKVETFRRRTQLDALFDFLQKIGLKLYCDFTPVGKLNQDLAIINWFHNKGKKIDFEVAVYSEYDMFLTKTISELYAPYFDFDAGFVNYRVAEPSWTWTDHPWGSKRSVCKWLESQNAKSTLYGSFFPGHFLSRKVLQKLSEQKMPSAFCEMRLPTMITGLGFSVANLNFPMVNRTFDPAGITRSQIRANADLGVFHPVYGDFDL